MKLLDLALIAGAAWLIFGNKGSAAATAETGFSGYSGSSLPGTTIPTSNKLQEVINQIPATTTTLAQTATQQDLGTINVTQASVSSSGAAVKAATEVFSSAYSSGKYVPSSAVSGKGLTAWDLRIAANLAAKK